MKMTTTTDLTVEQCWCGIMHAVPSALVDGQYRDHNDGRKVTGIYCPLGHVWVPSGVPEVDKLRARNDELSAQLTSTRDQLDTATADLVRHRARAAKGVCPCCKRSFVQLARHMHTQHPGYPS